MAVHRRVERKRPLLTVIESGREADDAWGLCFTEDADRPFQRAAVFWDAAVDASVCPVAAVPSRNSGDSRLFDPAHLKVAATVLVRHEGDQHLQLCDGVNAIQLHVVEGTLLDGPVRLAYVLEDFGRLNHHTVTLERLGAVLERGRFPASLFPSEPQADRWLLTLKAIELEAAGLSHADIAAQLYESGSRGSFATDWRRSRVRRLLEAGHAMIDRDYLKILARPTKVRSKAA
ncbi:MAG: DUF2285 domain-containing protein [Rhodospirillaceae bacterium]|nr:DUF2285 domain-containing protein [Rhodospirillaceae bacterium]